MRTVRKVNIIVDNTIGPTVTTIVAQVRNAEYENGRKHIRRRDDFTL